MNNIAEETRITVNMLNKFGALTKTQINKMCEGTFFDTKPMISFLCYSRMAQLLDDTYVVLQNRPEYSPETLYCIWVMLDKIKSDSIIRSQEIRSANPCDNGIEVCFINQAKTIEYIAFIDKANIAKVSLIQDTFYTTTGVTPGYEDKSHRLYNFVVNDEEVMDILAEMGLTIPYIVAFVEGDLAQHPSIEYYKL